MRDVPTRTRPWTLRLAAPMAALALLSGCSVLGTGAGGEAPPEKLGRGVAAIEAGQYRAAYQAAEEVAAACAGAPLGQQALLLQAAMDLDPRIPFGTPQRAAGRLARLLARPERPAWLDPLAESLYVLALEMGAERPSPGPAEASSGEGGADCDALAWDGGGREAGAALPRLPGTSLADRNAYLRQRVVELEEELERLRALLEPPR